MNKYELKLIRLSMRLSQKDLGKLLGVSMASIQGYERGAINVPDDLKEKLQIYRYKTAKNYTSFTRR